MPCIAGQFLGFPSIQLRRDTSHTIHSKTCHKTVQFVLLREIVNVVVKKIYMCLDSSKSTLHLWKTSPDASVPATTCNSAIHSSVKCCNRVVCHKTTSSLHAPNQTCPNLPVCYAVPLHQCCAILIGIGAISVLKSKIFDTFGIVSILVLKGTPLGYRYWYWFWNLLLLGFGIGFETASAGFWYWYWFWNSFCWVLVLVLVSKLTSAGFWYWYWFWNLLLLGFGIVSNPKNRYRTGMYKTSNTYLKNPIKC